jgi:hypothetical protein
VSRARQLDHRRAERARSPAAAVARPAAPVAARVLALQRAAGNRATARAVALMRTPKEISVTRSDPPSYGWTARFSAELSFGGVTLTIRAKIDRDADVTEAQETAVKAQTSAEFKRIWDSRFVVSDDGGNSERLVRVKVEYVDTGQHLTIALHKGSREDNRRNWYVDSPAIHRAHELGHQLGLFDEKLDPAVEDRKDAKSPGVFQDNSVMGDYIKEGIDKATAKLRHGQSIVAEVGKAFGKTFTVRMNVPL